MPIYMDFHDLQEVNIEDSKKAHLRDVSIQEKYQVKYLQYWINEEEGKAYCLIEGPNKEACIATHKEANGIKACNLVEVKGGMYDLFLGDNQKIDQGLVRHFNGEVDNGYRFILYLQFIKPFLISTSEKTFNKTADQLKLACIGIVEKHHGRDINQTEEDSFIGIFRTSEAALNCCLDLRRHITDSQTKTKQKSFTFKMGLCVGQPVTEDLGFFEEALNLSEILCNIASISRIKMSKIFSQLSNFEERITEKEHFEVVETQDIEFLTTLYKFTSNNLEKEALNVDLLGRELDVSSAQLYRKVKSLTGISPNHFIRDHRLNKAMKLLKMGNSNISEIALEVGFNNPSYFSKCFQNKFGKSPSKIK